MLTNVALVPQQRAAKASEKIRRGRLDQKAFPLSLNNLRIWLWVNTPHPWDYEPGPLTQCILQVPCPQSWGVAVVRVCLPLVSLHLPASQFEIQPRINP